MIAERLQRQMEFLIEIDKLKHVFRRTLLMDKSRHENDAEHSWHLAMMALILSEYANEREIDLLRVVKMLLVHDLVEIDAGDTYAYDETGNTDKAQREQAAAHRLFSMLPSDQAEELHALWEEFEQHSTAESRFAAVLDRLQPLMHNYHTQGAAWQQHGITSDKVLKRAEAMKSGSEPLWQYAEKMIRSAVEKGYLLP